MIQSHPLQGQDAYGGNIVQHWGVPSQRCGFNLEYHVNCIPCRDQSRRVPN